MTARFPSPLLREALAAHGRGWCLTPLKGKVPVLKDWPHAPRPTETEIRKWAAKGNLGVRTGSASGIVVIDADAGSDVTPLDLPETWTAITGADGRHYVYGLNGGPPIGNSAGKLGPKIDAKAEAGQVVLAGSIHPDTGKLYRWAPDLSPDDLPLADLPAHIAERLAPKPKPAPKPTTRVKAGNAYGRAALAREVEAVRNAPEHTRNDRLNRAAFSLGQLVAGGVLVSLEVEAHLTAAARQAGLEEHEIRATIQSGLAAGAREPRTGQTTTEATPPRAFPVTDSGNGELASLYGDRLRFDHRRGRWLHFGPHHWRADALAEIYQLGKEAARARYADAPNCPEPKDRKAAASWALGSESRSRIEAALHLARSETPIADSGEDWDGDLYLAGVVNGVLDLQTGELRDGHREDRITMVIPIVFDLDAPAPRFERFLSEVFNGDTDMIGFTRRACGYSLAADTREQCLFLCHGPGANGKTTLLRALRETLGPYAADTPFSTLELNARASIPSDVAALAGKRLVTASETGATSRLNESRIKALTGGDDVTARFMHEDWFTFRPTFKLWLACNRLPRVADTSKGFWRRVRLIPFTQSFDPATEPDLETKLRAEAPGILAWTVRGCLEWQRIGLKPPEAVTKATAEYQAASDPLADFLDECCNKDPLARERAGRLHRAYAAWAARQRLRDFERLGSRTFGEEIGARFDKVKLSDGAYYIGIQLNDNGAALADKEAE